MQKRGRKPKYDADLEAMAIGDWLNIAEAEVRALQMAASRFGRMNGKRFLIRQICPGLYRLMRFD